MARITSADLPEAVRSLASAVGAEQWLHALPDTVAGLEAEWGMTVGRVLPNGHEALVAEVTLDEGTPAVLKMLVATGDTNGRNEIAALRLAHGEGCALLLRADIPRGAMLLERLGAPLGISSLSSAQRREVLCAAAMRFWGHAVDVPLPTGAEKGRWLIEFVRTTWEELGKPCSAGAVEYAVECAERRVAAHDERRAVLVHGDIHEWNALASESGYKLIDPDGLFAEAEYELGVIMRQDPVGEAADSARWLAERTGKDEAAILEWATIERLSTSLHCTRLGIQPLGREMLKAAELAAEAGK